MTRQSRWQQAKLSSGKCVQCGREPIAEGFSKRYGVKCLQRHRSLQRIRRARA